MSNHKPEPLFPQDVLNVYDRFMFLQIFIDSDDEKLVQKYKESINKHNNKILNINTDSMDTMQHYIDAGFDLFVPYDIDAKKDGGIIEQYKIDHQISCSAVMFTSNGKRFNTGYYLYPRSSITKTDIRLANSTGIIDSGYRGHLIGMFDHHNKKNNSVTVNDTDTNTTTRIVNAYDRVLQICAPGLVPIIAEVVDNIESLGLTERGNKGFGSSGK